MNAEKERIYLSPPHMAPESRERLLSAFDSNWIAPVGPDLDAFEVEFADYVGAKYAVAVSSGTAAIHLALRVAGVIQNDVVPVSTLTFVAPANAVCYLGGKPIFIDSEQQTWNMDPGLLRAAVEDLAAVGQTPKAIIVVDVFGQCADFTPIREICEEHKVVLIEDAAESLGASYDGHNAGTLGDIGCFSFNGNKMITTSGGGMLVTNERAWADKARYWSTQARDSAAHYEHSQLGYNYRMSNLLAAIGRGQMQALRDRVRRRKEIFSWYRDRLTRLPGIELMPESPKGDSSCWLSCILVDENRFGASREDIRIALQSQNIESRPCWKPMHLQPSFAATKCYGGEYAEHIFHHGLCLPSGSCLLDSQLERIARIIEQVGLNQTTTL